MPSEHVDTVIGTGAELKGSLHTHGTVHIHGKVTGDIATDGALVIGETAVVNGPVAAKHVDIAGSVYGSVTAEEHLEVQAKGFIKGDIVTVRLSIKPGAVFIGSASMPAPNEESLPERKKPRLEVE